MKNFDLGRAGPYGDSVAARCEAFVGGLMLLSA